MNSILNNSAALSALQSLQMTQQALGTTQREVSTGLAVATAKDNASYWSIAEQLKANSGIANAANTTLAQSQAAFDTANSAIKSVITTINSIQSTLTQATNPGASFSTINTTLASLSKQLGDAINGASFNGVNLLDGSTTTSNFVSGYNAGNGTVTTINFTAQSLATGQAGGTTTTQVMPTITDASTVAGLKSMLTTLGGAGGNGVTAANASYGNDSIVITAGAAGPPAVGDSMVITSKDVAGTVVTKTYTAIDANGQGDTSMGGATAAGFTLSVTTAPAAAASTSLFDHVGTTASYDLSSLGTGGTTVNAAVTAQDALSAATSVLKAVTDYAALIGATQDRMAAASNFNSSLTTDYANGVSALVDADMNTASTRLQALQTQQQLGIQSLSIANQNAQLILKLFP